MQKCIQVENYISHLFAHDKTHHTCTQTHMQPHINISNHTHIQTHTHTQAHLGKIYRSMYINDL